MKLKKIISSIFILNILALNHSCIPSKKRDQEQSDSQKIDKKEVIHESPVNLTDTLFLSYRVGMTQQMVTDQDRILWDQKNLIGNNFIYFIGNKEYPMRMSKVYDFENRLVSIDLEGNDKEIKNISSEIIKLYKNKYTLKKLTIDHNEYSTDRSILILWHMHRRSKDCKEYKEHELTHDNEMPFERKTNCSKCESFKKDYNQVKNKNAKIIDRYKNSTYLYNAERKLLISNYTTDHRYNTNEKSNRIKVSYLSKNNFSRTLEQINDSIKKIENTTKTNIEINTKKKDVMKNI